MIGFGIVGIGMIAEFHARALECIGNARLVGCYSRSREKRERFSELHSCRTYDTLDAFLSDPDIDVVIIATPSGAHLDAALASARTGHHVLIEKPLEITEERCSRIISCCRENGVKLGGIFQSRYQEASKAMKKAVEDGRFGRIAFASAQIKWYRSQEYYDSGLWRGTKALDGGGCMMNQGIHAIDLLRWFMGDVVSVSAFGGTLGHERIEVEDTAAVVLRFADGAIGTIEATTCAYPGCPKRIEIMGSDGTAVMEEDSIVRWEFRKPLPEDEDIRRRLGASGSQGGAGDPSAISFKGHQMLFESFIRAIMNDSEPDITGEEASRSVGIINAAYRSMETGMPVSLPSMNP